jgi:hypothetical protein
MSESTGRAELKAHRRTLWSPIVSICCGVLCVCIGSRPYTIAERPMHCTGEDGNCRRRQVLLNSINLIAVLSNEPGRLLGRQHRQSRRYSGDATSSRFPIRSGRDLQTRPRCSFDHSSSRTGSGHSQQQHLRGSSDGGPYSRYLSHSKLNEARALFKLHNVPSAPSSSPAQMPGGQIRTSPHCRSRQRQHPFADQHLQRSALHGSAPARLGTLRGSTPSAHQHSSAEQLPFVGQLPLRGSASPRRSAPPPESPASD